MKVNNLVFLLMSISLHKRAQSFSLCPRLCICQGTEARCHGIQTQEDFHRILSTLPVDTKRLDVSRNNITNFHTERYTRLKYLEVLILNENLLTSIPVHLSTTLPSVRVLHMRKNYRLTKLSKTSFEIAFNLEKLDISDCGIEKLEDEIFYNNTLLVHLNLSKNKIRSVHENAFRGLGNLGSLNLNHNHLVELSRYVFQPLEMLTKLSLASNRIQSVPSNLFMTNNHLETINLANNQIRKLGLLNVIQNSSFNWASESNKQFNNITVFHRELELSHVSEAIYLQGNPINCDCHLLLSRDIDHLKLTGECKTPPRLKGRTFQSLSAKDVFNCTTQNKTCDELTECGNNNSTYCIEQPNGSAFCVCKNGFTGKFCEVVIATDSVNNTNNKNSYNNRENSKIKKKNQEWVFTVCLSLFIVAIGVVFAAWYYQKRKGRDLCSKTKCLGGLFIGVLIIVVTFSLMLFSKAHFVNE